MSVVLADPLVISIDAMGGDYGPSVVVPGVAAASLDTGNVRFLLHGDEKLLRAEVAASPACADLCEIRPASSVVAMDAKPAHAMRRGKGSSMWNAVESVRAGEAAAAVSAGNTGALMAISRHLLRMAGTLDRPALVANWPTLHGITAVLDVGANVVCDAERLVEFAVMGAAYHRVTRRSIRPTVGLLNIGTEHDKGHEEVKGADRLLRTGTFAFEYKGFVEGDDIAKGAADVIVTDGFTGNIALKTAEGLARFFRAELRRTFAESLWARAGAFVARRSLRDMAERLDPGRTNGGPFLGLNGMVVKSHGGADARAYATAVRLAIELGRGDFAAEISRNLNQIATPRRMENEERATA
ncbi:MAG TPA: phosphate acyltransferase PlsX [Caulobacteraceae bacterium]